MALLVEKTGKTERELPLLHEPGERWTYGMEVRVLGELVEELSGRTLPHFLKERIFDPLGMFDTFYVLPAERKWRSPGDFPGPSADKSPLCDCHHSSLVMSWLNSP